MFTLFVVILLIFFSAPTNVTDNDMRLKFTNLSIFNHLLIVLAPKMAQQEDLETKFEKINLEEGQTRKNGEKEDSTKDESKKNKVIKYSENPARNSFKAKDRNKNLIKPSRLKMCASRNNPESSRTIASAAPEEHDTSESFCKLRISPKELCSSQEDSDDKNGKTSPSSSQPNSCSAQAKLQPNFSSDSELLSEFLAYHLNLSNPHVKNYLVESMYT